MCLNIQEIFLLQVGPYCFQGLLVWISHLNHFQLYMLLSVFSALTVFWYMNAELYQQTLAKALAHHFDAKLLLLDLTDFSLKVLCDAFFSSILTHLLLILLFTLFADAEQVWNLQERISKYYHLFYWRIEFFVGQNIVVFRSISSCFL